MCRFLEASVYLSSLSSSERSSCGEGSTFPSCYIKASRITIWQFRNTETAMALPVQSVRAAPEHRDILQSVAELLKEGNEETVRNLLKGLGSKPVEPFRDE